MIKTHDGLEIDDTTIRGSQGKVKCPKCAAIGQKTDGLPLSVNLDDKVYNCHRCGWNGTWKTSTSKPMYDQPDLSKLKPVTDSILKHFASRGISEETVKKYRIVSDAHGNPTFTYWIDEKPIKLKSKKTDKSAMYQSKNSMPIIYNYNGVNGQSEIIITEGEEDALSFIEAGFPHACSVDMGAPNSKDANASKKLACITNAFDVFESAETIIIAVDNDDNGARLKFELLKKFGAHKCKIVNFGDFKDANDVLVSRGKEELIKCLKEAEYPKIDGIFRAKDFRERIKYSWKHGQPKGSSTFFPEIDKAWKWRTGEVTVWTGYNNEGKSMLLKQLQILKSIGDGWKHAVYTPEESPADEWYTDLIESYHGKSADKDYEQFGNYLTEMEIDNGIDFVDNYFINIYPKEDCSLDELLKLFSYSVRRYGIKTVTIDPYNQVDHDMKPGEREDLYISKFMSKLKRFAVDHDVAVILVAHQKTPKLEKGKNYPEPDIFCINGGGTFANKADNVCYVWRPNRRSDMADTSVRFASQKIKKQKLVGIPSTVELDFDRKSNRYSDVHGSIPLENIKKPEIDDTQTSMFGDFTAEIKKYQDVRQEDLMF